MHRFVVESANATQNHAPLLLDRALANISEPDTPSSKTRYTLRVAYPAHPTALYPRTRSLDFVITKNEFEYLRRLPRGTRLTLQTELENDAPLLVMPND